MDPRLDYMEQSIAHTEMRITTQRALMRRLPDNKLVRAVLASLEDTLRLKMAMRLGIQTDAAARDRVPVENLTTAISG